MDARDLFLDQHGGLHSTAVAGDKMSVAERVLGGLSEEQMRVRPREDLNSLAWILWHIARTEDVFVNLVLAGRAQVLDEGWTKRLGVARPDIGTGMKSAEVTDLTRQVDLGALRDYRDAVGRRTRDIVGGFRPEDWEGAIAAPGVERAAAEGAFGPVRELFLKAFPGRPRALVLSRLALFHTAGHLGEAGTVRSAGGFGTGL
jgi:hypothetical protein